MSSAARTAVAVLAGGLAVLLLTVAVAAVTVALLGGDPARSLQAIHLGSIARPSSLGQTLVRATPLLLCGLSIALAFRSGLFNIGAEGQLLVGMLGAAATAQGLGGASPWLAVPLCLAASGLAGALWAAVPAALRLWRGVPEVISTLMLNFAALYLLEYLVRGPMRDPSSTDDVGALLPETTRLPRLGSLLGAGVAGGDALRLPNGQPLVALGVELTYLHLGVVLAGVTAAMVWFWMARSGFGFRMRAVGSNPAAAASAGISVTGTLAWAFLLSGVLAGLAGGIEQLGALPRLHRYTAGEPGYGFTGIAVALLGQLHPGGVVLAAVFFGALRAGCDQMQRSAGVSFHVAYVIQAVVVLALVSLPGGTARALVERLRASKAGTVGGSREPLEQTDGT